MDNISCQVAQGLLLQKEVRNIKPGRQRPSGEATWLPNLDLIRIFLPLHFGSICFPCEIAFEESCPKLNTCVYVCVFLLFAKRNEKELFNVDGKTTFFLYFHWGSIHDGLYVPKQSVGRF